MKKHLFFILIFTVLCLPVVFSDTEITPYFSLPGEWAVIKPGEGGFAGSPTEKDGIEPFAKLERQDGKYFGYLFSYETGAMAGSGSPMMGDYEFYPEWAEFGWGGLWEADFRSILQKFGSDLRRQHFWEIPGREERFGMLYAAGYARFNEKRYGFTAITRTVDVAWYMTAIIFCDADDYNRNFIEMKDILGIKPVL